jgi:hypothetical protein
MTSSHPIDIEKLLADQLAAASPDLLRTAGEITEPRHDLLVIGGQSSTEHLTDIPVQSTSEYRTCVHIQPDSYAESSLGPPHLPASTQFLSANQVHM